MIVSTDMTVFLINIGHTKDTLTALEYCNVQMWLGPMIKDPYLGDSPSPSHRMADMPSQKNYIFLCVFFLFHLICVQLTCYNNNTNNIYTFIYNSKPIYNFLNKFSNLYTVQFFVAFCFNCFQFNLFYV